MNAELNQTHASRITFVSDDFHKLYRGKPGPKCISCPFIHKHKLCRTSRNLENTTGTTLPHYTLFTRFFIEQGGRVPQSGTCLHRRLNPRAPISDCEDRHRVAPSVVVVAFQV